ncbi:hypothetical protein [Amycolatopsis sp. CA-230715]|uniref:hypothetical protein n=1 Tax=Amycolatopsis sp. CA-230715 TaxID=2745196 RepID=UPI001C01BC47|nr:hypothetical protein [Amycolatopsis sp. CA-230715]QWF78351.1 hypothetical protein HUW46_01746 [Amycolatopsis sp. CA-230715]
MLELGSRRRRLPPPPKVVWASLVDPHLDPSRPWLDLLGDETEPRILESAEPGLVVWSSLWPSRPDDVIRFDVEPDGVETGLRWTLLTSGEAPDESKLGHLRFRLNKLLYGGLRGSYGQ